MNAATTDRIVELILAELKQHLAAVGLGLIKLAATHRVNAEAMMAALQGQSADLNVLLRMRCREWCAVAAAALSNADDEKRHAVAGHHAMNARALAALVGDSDAEGF